MNLRPSLILAIVFGGCALTQSPSNASSFPSAKVFDGKLDTDGLPTSGARLCVEPTLRNCFQMPASSPKGEPPGFYQFGLEPSMKPLPVKGGGSWLLFSATFSGGGSGTLTRFAILRMDGTHINNLLPNVALTNNSDNAVWNEPDLSPFPLFVDADYIWNFKVGETHFSKHFFAVEVWRFDPSKDHYSRALTYKTSKRYDGLDAADPINVIAPERSEILRRLKLPK